MLNRILHKLFGFRIMHSQCGEDFIIESMMPTKKNGVYIDVGANHPFKYNNTLLFYRKGWAGINIEPNHSRMWLFKLWRRRDINLNVGIGRTKSEIDFYVFNESTLSTFDKDSSVEYQKMGHSLKKVVRIPVVSLMDIYHENLKGQEVDILSVDTEGFDMQVLESNDWNVFRPRFVILETMEYKQDGSGKKTNSTFDPYMNQIGYTKVADTYINTIYEKTY